MDSSCLPTNPCSARRVTLCQQFVSCIANDGAAEEGWAGVRRCGSIAPSLRPLVFSPIPDKWDFARGAWEERARTSRPPSVRLSACKQISQAIKDPEGSPPPPPPPFSPLMPLWYHPSPPPL